MMGSDGFLKGPICMTRYMSRRCPDNGVHFLENC